MKKIAIIGGGAAGLMCAATILEDNLSSCHITLYDRNAHLGAKVIISGGGRCNVTTGYTRWSDLANKYVRGSSMVKNLFSSFGPREIRAWFENNGIKLKEESDKRVFPTSDDGEDVVRVFEKIFTNQAKQITCKKKTSISHIEKNTENSLYRLTEKDGVITDYDILVIATGGNAYAHTGSRGDGYDFARALGHTITDLGPSLASLEVEENWLHKLSGQSFPNASVRTMINGEMVSVSHALLITHFGISGPATFTLAAHLAFMTLTKDDPHTIHLIPKEGHTTTSWDDHLRDSIEKSGKKKCHRHLEEILPRSFVSVFLDTFFPDLPERSAEIGKKTRREIASLLGDGIPIHITGRRAGDEFVTAGGVTLSEIDSKTCASHIAPHVYLVGEVLDIDGVTGGYNLSSSWSSGRAAGKSIVKNILSQNI